MTLFEDIISDIQANGGVITNVEIKDSFAEITYTDANGNVVTNKYKIVINDDGSEDWIAI